MHPGHPRAGTAPWILVARHCGSAILSLVVVALVLAGCRRLAGPPPPEPTPLPETPAVAAHWRSYPAAPGVDEWPVQPLDDARWTRASADLACAGRALHGDPDAHHQAARRILFRHQTTAQALMDYGVAVNQDGPRALALGADVAASAERCR